MHEDQSSNGKLSECLLSILVHFPVDGYNSSTTPDKPPRSMSQTKASSRKSKLSLSSSSKQKHGKSSSRHKESKWYLDTRSAAACNTNNNNNNNNSNENNFTMLSTFSTPNIDQPGRKLGKMSFSLRKSNVSYHLFS